MEKIRKMFVDLEVNSEGGMPSIKEAPAEIQSIAVYDNFLMKYNVFILSNGTPKFKLPPHNLFFYETEKELILKFIEYINATDPDMFIAYFGDQFDFPYIINRMKTLRLNPGNLSRINKCYSVEDKYINGFKNTCKGRILFDIMYGIKHISQGERASWKLDYIANYELGIGKTKYEGSLANLYKDNLKLFIEYNIRDVELMVMLDDKLHVVDFFDTMRRYARCHFSDVFKASKLVDSLLLKHAKMRGVVLPSKNFKSERKIKGAFVQDIKPGLYKGIAVLDWAGLYPNIIRTFNLSPEVMTKDVFGDVIRVKNKFMKNTLYFKKDVEGLIPELIRTVIEERKVFKKLMHEATTEEERHAYDILQYAVKVAANSVFGVIKDKCRLSNIDIAEAITTMGYYIIKKSAEIAEKYGYKVIYMDTDSLFCIIGNHSYEEIQELADIISKEIAEHLKEQFNIKESTLDMEFEKVFKTVLFAKKRGTDTAAKKKYASLMILKDGVECDKITIMGFDTKRSDSPQSIRDFQKEMFTLILHEKSQKDVDNYVDDFTNKFKTLPVSEIAFIKGLSKDFIEYTNMPIHVRAALLSNKRHNANIKKGDKIKFIYVTSNPRGVPFENVIALVDEKLPEGYTIDYKKMTDNLVWNKIETIYESLGWCRSKDGTKSLFEF